MYYAGTIAALRAAIEEKFPGTKAEYQDLVTGETAPLSYLLWMCDEVAKMDTASVEEAVKAGRWVGWIFAHAEMYGVWTNTETRDYVRADRAQGLDRPHSA